MNTGSVLSTPTPPLSSYDNNNEANAHKMKQQQHLRSGSSVGSSTGGSNTNTASTVTVGQTGSGNSSSSSRRRRSADRRNEPVRGTACARAHLNSLWSVWYGFFGTFMQAYTAVKCMKRFLRYSVLPWTSVEAVWELHTCMLLTAFAVMLLPFFLASAIFKIGNYANDGYKIGRGVPSVGGRGAEFFLGTGSCNSLWRHAGPTAAFLHLVIAFCMLVPKLVMEARLVQYGFLPSDALWRTDLDFMVVHHDRLVVLSFMTAAVPGNGNLTSSSANFVQSTASPIPVQGMMNSALTAAALVMNGSMGSHQEATTPKNMAMDILEWIREFFKNDSDNDLDLDAHVDSGFGSSVSVEYLNYALALIVYSVRYPAVFWSTNKCFGVIFSLQLLVNSIQSLLSFAGMSVLYKVQIVGAWKALPLLRHYPNGVSFLGGHAPFLLNPHVTLALFTLSNMLILASSLILYLYGHNRFNAFLNQHRDKSRHIFADTRIPPTSSNTFYDADSPSWGYLTHCAALCALVATAVTNAPLLHDYTVVYRGSLDGAVLACVIAALGHLFLWVLVWLFLTIKHKWTFKIRITVGRATVRSARSVRLITDVELASRRTAALMASNRRRNQDDDEHPNGANSTSNGDICAGQPLLVVGNGRAYAVTETTSRKAIMSVVQKVTEKSREEGKSGPNGAGSSEASPGGSDAADDDNEEQIYWLRPAIATPHHSPDSSSEDRLCWFSSKKQSSQHSKHKVTFNEATSTSNIRNNKNCHTKAKLRGTPGGNGVPDEDDGDYATLRELPLLPSMMPDPEDDNTSEEGKLLACVHDDNVTYASTSRDLIPPADYEDPSPLLTPEPLSERDEAGSSAKTNPVNVTVHNVNNNNNNHAQVTITQTPRCLRRADSGMPHEELTPRSDSISTESSTSPPDPPGSNNSETSSGVHSNASSDHHHQVPQQQIENQQIVSRRATSVADLVQQQEECRWKSSSLQRNVQPPNPIYGYSTNGSVIGYTTAPIINGQIINPAEATVQTIVVQRNPQQPIVNAASIYGYTTSTGVVTNDSVEGVQTVVVRATSNQQHYQPGCSNGNQSLYGYTTAPNKIPNGLDNQNGLIKPPNANGHTSIYGYTKANNKIPTQEVITEHGGIPAVILENTTENTVVIRRKPTNPAAVDIQKIPVIKEEPFGRSTNMRMTSFTEHNDLKNIQASSATLPHYPTQPVPPPTQYPHCSTMPLPHNSQSNNPPNLGAGTSCNVYPRQHTTIPTHHNGVRLFPTNQIQNPYVKRVQNYQNGGARLNGTAEGIYGGSGKATKAPGDMYHYNS